MHKIVFTKKEDTSKILTHHIVPEPYTFVKNETLRRRVSVLHSGDVLCQLRHHTKSAMVKRKNLILWNKMYIDILAASVYKHSPEGTASVYKCRVAYKRADIYKLLDS